MVDLNNDEARVNVTYGGFNGDLPDPVFYESTDADVKAMVTEALENGDIPGIPAQAEVDLTNFVLDKFRPTEARPWSLLALRPKTPFGK